MENGGTLTAVALDDYSYHLHDRCRSYVDSDQRVRRRERFRRQYVLRLWRRIHVKRTFKSTAINITPSSAGPCNQQPCRKFVRLRRLRSPSTTAGSSIEIGTTGGAAAGSITIDAGKTVTEQGIQRADVIVSGTLMSGRLQIARHLRRTAVNGSVSIGKTPRSLSAGLSGAGTVTIGGGADVVSLRTRGATTASHLSPGRTAVWRSTQRTSTAPNGFRPEISGFAAADMIDFTDDTAAITSAQYAAGELDLYSGAIVEATLEPQRNLRRTFSRWSNSAASWTYQVNYEGAGPKAAAPAGTTSGDAYQWVGPVSGFWSTKTNWDDTSQGQDPAEACAGRRRFRHHRAGRGQRGAGPRRRRQRLRTDDRRRDPVPRRLQGGRHRRARRLDGYGVGRGAVVAMPAMSLNITGDATFDNYT